MSSYLLFFLFVRWKCFLLKVVCRSVRRETHTLKIQSWDGTTRTSSRAWSTRYSPQLLELVGVLRKMFTDVCRFQRAAQGMHNLQFSLGLERVSPAPCPSHSFLVKIQTNLRDRLEHTALFGLCPLQPVSTFCWEKTIVVFWSVSLAL